MPCHLTIYDTEAKTKAEYVCDEDNTTRIIEDEHAASETGQYADLNGTSLTLDWTKCRLVAFQRKS